MKFLYLLIILHLPNILFAQEDSIKTYRTKGFNLRYYNPSQKDTLEIKNSNSISLKGDSLITSSTSFNVNQLNSLSFRVGNYGFWRGAKHGAIAGSIIGLFAIYAYGNRIDWGHEGGSIVLLPILLSGSAILGAITGGIISMSNGRYLDYNLSGAPSEYKRKELIRLIEKYGKIKN